MALPDYLTEQTEQRIRERMLDNVPPDLDKVEGSYIWDALTPAAIELELAAIWAQEVLRRGFAETAFGDYLTMRAAEHGVDRRQAVRASGYVTFVGKPGIVIPMGTRVGTAADEFAETIWYVTMEDIIIPPNSQATVLVEAEKAGVIGNILAGSIELTAQPIPYLETVTNNGEITGGAEEESDENLRSRYYIKVRNPGTSGNKADYRNWAMQVPGVGGVQVVPLWAGRGTVKLLLLGDDLLPASPTVIAATQDYIAPKPDAGDGKAPIGATVTIVPAITRAVDITAGVALNGTKNIEQVTNAFGALVRTYFDSLTRKYWSMDVVDLETCIVSYAKIGGILVESTEGVADYTDLLINDTMSSAIVAPGEVAVLRSVVLYER